MHAVWVSFVWLEFTDDAGVSDIPCALLRDVVVAYGLGRIGAGNAFKVRMCRVFANVLVEAAQSIGI